MLRKKYYNYKDGPCIKDTFCVTQTVVKCRLLGNRNNKLISIKLTDHNVESHSSFELLTLESYLRCLPIKWGKTWRMV